jgi:hypothetical protein
MILPVHETLPAHKAINKAYMRRWISQVHVVLRTHLNILLTYKEGKKGLNFILGTVIQLCYHN